MTGALERSESKVPEITLGFWIIKIAATTLGETGRRHRDDDIELGLPCRNSIVSVASLRTCRLADQRQRNFIRWLYWATIVASTTAGTTMADYFSTARSASATPVALRRCWRFLLVSLGMWWLSERTVRRSGYGEHAEGRAVLLGDHHPVSDFGHGAGSLDGGRRRASASSAARRPVRCGPGDRRRSSTSSRDARLEGGALSAWLNSRPPARRHPGRLPRQTHRSRRPGA